MADHKTLAAYSSYCRKERSNKMEFEDYAQQVTNTNTLQNSSQTSTLWISIIHSLLGDFKITTEPLIKAYIR